MNIDIKALKKILANKIQHVKRIPATVIQHMKISQCNTHYHNEEQKS